MITRIGTKADRKKALKICEGMGFVRTRNGSVETVMDGNVTALVMLHGFRNIIFRYHPDYWKFDKAGGEK